MVWCGRYRQKGHRVQRILTCIWMRCPRIWSCVVFLLNWGDDHVEWYLICRKSRGSSQKCCRCKMNESFVRDPDGVKTHFCRPDNSQITIMWPCWLAWSKRLSPIIWSYLALSRHYRLNRALYNLLGRPDNISNCWSFHWTSPTHYFPYIW